MLATEIEFAGIRTDSQHDTLRLEQRKVAYLQ